MRDINDIYKSIKRVSHDCNNCVYILTTNIELYAMDHAEFNTILKKVYTLGKFSKEISHLRNDIEEKMRKSVLNDDKYALETECKEKELINSCINSLESVNEEYKSSNLESLVPEFKNEFQKKYNLLKTILHQDSHNPSLVPFKVIKNKFKELVSSDGIEIIFRDYSRTPIFADSDNIITALLNATNNAIKAIKTDSVDKKGRITITAEEIGQNHTLTVSDNGPGFKDLDEVVNKSTVFVAKKEHNYGLTIISDIAKAHNGKVYIGNNLRGGALVEVIIPKYNEYPNLNLLSSLYNDF